MSASPLCPTDLAALEHLRDRIGMRPAARMLGIGIMSMYRACSSKPIRPGTATQIRLGVALAAAQVATQEARP